jgi:hypothetical protein
MQIPMPHSGPRGWPMIDLRQAAPQIKIAAATLVPCGTLMMRPFMLSVIVAAVSRRRVEIISGQSNSSRAGQITARNALDCIQLGILCKNRWLALGGTMGLK